MKMAARTSALAAEKIRMTLRGLQPVAPCQPHAHHAFSLALSQTLPISRHTPFSLSLGLYRTRQNIDWYALTNDDDESDRTVISTSAQQLLASKQERISSRRLKLSQVSCYSCVTRFLAIFPKLSSKFCAGCWCGRQTDVHPIWALAKRALFVSCCFDTGGESDLNRRRIDGQKGRRPAGDGHAAFLMEMK